MKILQIVTSLGRPCGVANFANHLEIALGEIGVSVSTSGMLDAKQSGMELIILHHEWGLFPNDETIHQFCRSATIPVILFAHTSGVARFANFVAGFIAMHPESLQDCAKPKFTFPHTAITPSHLSARNELRSKFGLPLDRPVIGSNGFLTETRLFPDILNKLLPIAFDRDWFIDLITSEGLQPYAQMAQLDEIKAKYPQHFRYNTVFLPPEELNLRLQACDLLWCWQTPISETYASGVASDQYASGTRVVVSDISPHRHITNLPNVVPASPDLDEFVQSIVNECERGNFSRHDPNPLSWHHWSPRFAGFLKRFTTKAVN